MCWRYKKSLSPRVDFKVKIGLQNQIIYNKVVLTWLRVHTHFLPRNSNLRKTQSRFLYFYTLPIYFTLMIIKEVICSYILTSIKKLNLEWYEEKIGDWIIETRFIPCTLWFMFPPRPSLSILDGLFKVNLIWDLKVKFLRDLFKYTSISKAINK